MIFTRQTQTMLITHKKKTKKQKKQIKTNQNKSRQDMACFFAKPKKEEDNENNLKKQIKQSTTK